MSLSNSVSNASVNIDIKQDEKLAKFYHICKFKYINIEKWILQNNLVINSCISKNSPTFPGYTPLHLAVECNNLQAVKSLLEYNADFTQKNVKGQTALHLGMNKLLYNRSCNKEKNLKLILDTILTVHKNKYVNPVDEMGLTHFHVACFRNNYYIVLGFLENGVELDSPISFNSRYWSGYTPLHIASRYSFLCTATLLLKYGANVNAKNSAGLTPLHCAIKNGDGLLIKYLYSVLSQNYIDPVDTIGLSELHARSAVNSGSYSLEKIVQNEIDTHDFVKEDSPLWAGYTPLHIAVHNKCLNVIILLMQYGADINIKNSSGTSAFQLAIQKQLINISFMDFILYQYNKVAKKSIDKTELFKLFSSCISGLPDSIQYFLNNGLNVNSTVPLNYPIDLPGYTALHFAVERGDVEIVELLLRNGADFCIQDVNGLSPLHLAAHRGNHSIIKKILSFHSHVKDNLIDMKGLSHLHIICMDDKIEIVKEFLQKGASVDLATKDGETLLHFAVKFGSKKSIKLLLEHNADITAIDIDGLTPLHLAVQSKNENIINMLLSYHTTKTINPISKEGLSHFHIACMTNRVNIVTNFLTSGVDVNASVHLDSKRYAGFTPLHFAVKNNCIETVKVLLNHGADLTTKDAKHKVPLHYAFELSSDNLKEVLDLFWSTIEIFGTGLINMTGLTALHIACMKDDYFAVQNLLKQGLTVNITTSLHCPLWSSYSPLHFAVKYGSLETVQLLLSNNADVNIVDKHGFTPLHLACSCSKLKIVESLLASGCDPTLKSIKGLTPVRMAMQAKNDQIVRMVLSTTSSYLNNPMDNKGFTYFHIACLKNMPDVVKKFLVNGIDVNESVHPLAPQFSGYTSLHIAVARKNNYLIDLLLTHNANPNIVNSEGSTPLHLTCLPRSAHADITFKLLQHGADPDIRNSCGETLIELAIKYNKLIILEIALKYGANPNLENLDISSSLPLDLAISYKREKMVYLLLKNGADATVKSQNGSTFIYKTISEVQAEEDYYTRIITSLVEHGCDLDACNVSGRTALHCSYWPVNVPGLKALLRCGADVDVEDRSGRSVISYFLEITSSRVPRVELYVILFEHLQLRKIAGFELSDTNKALYQTLLETRSQYLSNGEDEEDDDEDFVKDVDNYIRELEVFYSTEVQKMKDFRFGGYTSLWDIFINHNNMARQLSRNPNLGEFFSSDKLDELFPVTNGLIMMQYKKALKRRDLLQPALEAIDKLMCLGFAEICWNDECSEALIEFLGDEDLRNLAEI